jgi:V8-like Glu-specific endopeptidase
VTTATLISIGNSAGGTGAVFAETGGTIQAGGGISMTAGSTLSVDSSSSIEAGSAGGATPGAVTIDAGSTLSGAGTIDGSVIDNGLMTSTGGALAVSGNLSIGSGGTVSATSGGTIQANTISAGTSDAGITITNFSGSLTGSAPSSSPGATVTLTGADSGNATIGSNSTLELANGASLAGTIDFGSASGGTLKIDGTTMPTNIIKGFEPGNVIDLKNVPLNSFGYTLLETTASPGGYNILQIVDGGNYYLNLQLPQNFTGGFTLSPDASGSGTDVMAGPSFVPGSALIGSPAPVLSPYNTRSVTGYSTYPVSVASAAGGATPNPYGAVVQIITTVNGVLKGEATGFIIDSYPAGGGIILTAAHVLNEIPPGGQISIYAANATYGNGGVPIFANVPQFDLKPNPAFDDTFFPDPQDDFGIIKVPSNVSLNAYGVLPIDATFSGDTVNITGYPGPQISTQFSQIGSVTASPNFSGVFDENVPFSVPGQSGGPLWIYSGSTAHAVGIVSGGGEIYILRLTIRRLSKNWQIRSSP